MPVLFRQPRLHRHLLGVLIAQITSGSQRPGELLSREADLADEYQVSRGVVREALRGLEERGLVTVRHGHGAIVNPRSAWNELDADVLAAVFVGPDRTRALREMIEVRRIVEVEAAGLAAERGHLNVLAPIRSAFRQMQKSAGLAVTSADSDPFLIADVAFHKAVIDATGNQLLKRLADPLQQALLEARRPLVHPEDRVDVAVPGHRAVLVAIEAGDAVTARNAAANILTTVLDYLDRYEAESPRPKRASHRT